jgi:PAS domain S-box-containing protein
MNPENELLKRKIEETLKDKKIFEHLKSKSPEEMLQELSVYYTELEYQNDELLLSQRRITDLKIHFEDLYNNAPIGYVTYDENFKIVSVNNYFSELTGINKFENKRKQITDFIHPDSQDDFYFHIKNLKKNLNNEKCQISIKGKNRTIPGSIESNILKTDDGIIIRSAFMDLTNIIEANKKIKQQNEELKEANKEKDVLINEIHHRVKNNLQVIQSILNLQKNYTDNKTILNLLNDCVDRIKSMGLVHESLYQMDNLSKINMNIYIRNLIDHLRFSYFNNETNIQIIYRVDDIYLKIGRAVPFGLLLNELITNCLKHAFYKRVKGKITISLEKKEDKYELRVKDDGVGLDDDIIISTNINDEKKSYGIFLITVFANQLNGKLEIFRNNGTEFVLTF